MCEHLYQNLQLEVKPKKVFSILYYFGNFFGEPNCPMTMGFIYCLLCAEEY